MTISILEAIPVLIVFIIFREQLMKGIKGSIPEEWGNFYLPPQISCRTKTSDKAEFFIKGKTSQFHWNT